MLWFGGLGGGVQGEWAHEEDFAFFSEAGDVAVACDLLRERGGFENAGKMRPRRDSEGAVCGIAIVEMESDGEKLIEHGLRRSRVVDALFEGGEIETFGSYLFRERKHQILVPRDFPVGGGCFVEGDGLDGDGFGGEVAGGDELASEGEGRFPDGWVVEQATFAGTVILKQSDAESVEGVLRKTTWNETAAVELK